MIAAQYQPETFKYMLETHGDIFSIDINMVNKKGDTIFMIASRYQHEVVKYICQRHRLEIDINRMNEDGDTSLTYALSNPETLKYILEKFADKVYVNDTIFMKALEKFEYLESFKYLVEGKHRYKFDINKKFKGVTTLEMVLDANVETLKYVFENFKKQIDLNIIDSNERKHIENHPQTNSNNLHEH